MKEENKYNKIGGWLILVIIGYILSFINNYNLFHDIRALYKKGTMERLMNSTSSIYNMKLATLIKFEQFITITTMICIVIGLILMFQRRKIFPRYAIWLIIISHTFVIIDIIWLSIIGYESDANSISEAISGILAGIAWIFYFLKSERVKQTFIE